MSSVVAATMTPMEVTDHDVDRIPAGTVRVSREQFVAVWKAAERHVVEQPLDWYGAGVLTTCRWLAGAMVRPVTGPWYAQWAPVTKRTGVPYEEVVEAECLAAEVLLFRRPVPDWLVAMPGWLPGIVDTLNWAWRRSAEAPLPAVRTT